MARWLAAVLYLVVASGIPIPSLGGAKDLSEPFPCMYGRCGCRSAGQCWTSCCCHTKAELLAWAVAQDVTPPEGFDLDDGQCHEPVGGSASCCAVPVRPVSDCCSSDTPRRQAKKAPSETDSGVVLLEALKCQGASESWTGVAVSIPPTPFVLSLPYAASPHPLIIRAAAPDVRYAPPLPPPRHMVS